MGLGRVGGYIFVALVAALLTFYVVRVTNGDIARCDVHPRLTSQNLAAIKNNLERARAAAHEATMNDKHDPQAAYQAEEQSAEQQFVYDLHDALAAEYRRHRRALDGCF
ncbi:MAG: hypothetical protein JWM91_2570 [Rhodospirillales bacterium]|nr:hypothetical protein [Rhodospirillales bacterium]